MSELEQASDIPINIDYYPHRYTNFDQLCSTNEERAETIKYYLSQSLTTVDQEIEKYLLYDNEQMVIMLLNEYTDQIQDWVHVAVTAIFNQSSSLLMIAIDECHKRRFGCSVSLDPTKNEILWVCKMKQQMQPLFVFVDEHNTKIVEDLVATTAVFQTFWDYLSPENPRNLYYAIKFGNVDIALELLRKGCKADVWNNMPIRMCLNTQELRTNSKLVQALLTNGAKIPKGYSLAYRAARNVLSQLKSVIIPPEKPKHTNKHKIKLNMLGKN
jgi:hypothetical protein